jgi:hypothetical protein
MLPVLEQVATKRAADPAFVTDLSGPLQAPNSGWLTAGHRRIDAPHQSVNTIIHPADAIDPKH